MYIHSKSFNETAPEKKEDNVTSKVHTCTIMLNVCNFMIICYFDQWSKVSNQWTTVG